MLKRSYNYWTMVNWGLFFSHQLSHRNNVIQKLRNQNKEMTDTVRFHGVIFMTLSFLVITLCLIRMYRDINITIHETSSFLCSNFVVIYFLSKGLYFCQHDLRFLILVRLCQLYCFRSFNVSFSILLCLLKINIAIKCKICYCHGVTS